ncbi:MAG TPA: PQQ-dependent sugar dehydrogenase [Thermoanaerobaculia bacterium]|nr:PQQ-dependent sugar dehydrogenase [Thermoanaerobaculia bacterium]
MAIDSSLERGRRRPRPARGAATAFAALIVALASCGGGDGAPTAGTGVERAAAPAGTGEPAAASLPGCTLVERGFGPAGTVAVRVEEVASGLEVPWGLAFLPGGDLLVTERPGRLRLVAGGRLVPEPVATVEAAARGEGGLLGLALHPEFADNRLFFLYLTAGGRGRAQNRIERWRLAEDARSASRDRILLAGIPAASFHNGGRLRIGPDRMLYAGTGDAGDPELARDPRSPAGKLLRLTLDGEVPPDNPIAGSAAYLTGIRNTQGFDWSGDGSVWLVDHGPSGERGRRGHDEVNVARAGDDLGWPAVYGCETGDGLVTPALTWERAAPPGGAAIYTGSAIPEWRGSLLVGTLGSRHLHRVVFSEREPGRVARHEVYFESGGYGRLREVVMGTDGELYVTTSNCDGRGSCPAAGDRILRVTR